MIRSMLQELESHAGFFEEINVETIYFGGGTPSLLSFDDIAKMLAAISRQFKICKNPEITLEANPDDLQDLQHVRDLFKLGVNRLSIGIQSFNDQCLKEMNRAHDSQMAYHAYDNARNAGFSNLSLDLIYALPFDGVYALQDDLGKMLELDPEHISTYALTIEDKTVFGHQVRNGNLNETTEDDSADQYLLIMNRLIESGYHHYEISNFGKPGFESRHNSSYWEYKPYLGIGPGAHSFDGVRRWSNIRSNPKYISGILENTPEREYQDLSVADKVNEFILTSLRTSRGLVFTDISKLFQKALSKKQMDTLQRFEEQGLIARDDLRINLTTNGKLLADQIAMDLFIQ